MVAANLSVLSCVLKSIYHVDSHLKHFILQLDLWKQNNLTQLFNRLTGWQLQSFKESYDHKIKNGKPLNNKIIEKKK